MLRMNRRIFGLVSNKSKDYVMANSFSTSKKSWVPTTDENLQKVTIQSLIHEMSLQQIQSCAEVVPWFLKNMPASYFSQVPEALRTKHLTAIHAIRDLKQSNLSLRLESQADEGSSEITFISSNPTTKGLLHGQIRSLEVPEESYLSKVKVFSSLDDELALNVFSFETLKTANALPSPQDTQDIVSLISEIKEGKHADNPNMPQYSPLLSKEAMADYFKRITPAYATTSNPRRFLIQRLLFEKVKSTEGTAIHIEPYLPQQQLNSKGTHWITIAASNVLPEVLLRQSSSILTALNMDVNRAHLDVVRDPANATPELPTSGYVSMLRILVAAEEGIPPALPRILKRAKWLDSETTDIGLSKYPAMGIDKAEVITALCSMLHGPLAKINQQTFSSIPSVLRILDGSPHFVNIAESIAQLFLDRFRPVGPEGGVAELSSEEFARRAQEIQDKASQLHHEPARVLLLKLLEAVRLSLRTNFYNEDRYALSIRVDPAIMLGAPQDAGKPMPFGVFFSHGRHFNAFHCRFRDIARGGLRIVTPPNGDQHVLESSRQFDEAYGLSFAQQLKNKDIPEGGAKAVVLVNTPAIDAKSRFFAARKAVKAFTDSLLDLIVDDSVKNLVDYYGKDELIYLGPDEQVIPSDIDWICARAAQRGYPIPAAFMSSKKGAGINHKEYGVTSEGVVVYLDEALRNVLNIDPHKDSFTIKVTGGPDGDVAGNLMKILFREYGNNCKVVGIADGFGVAEDPNGLNSDELLRLVEASLPITHFNRSKLSPAGVLLDASTQEGLSRRLSMPFRVKADAFVPAGGRPNTINGDNWRQFLDADGKPSSPLIVEGANIFNTPEARENLFKHAGVVIVKDSSANKCGVVTSSCEVAASMLLSYDEFMTVKPELVQDVVVRLRELARLEAQLLFRAYKNYPGALPHFSERISMAIGKVTDAITDALAEVNPEDALFQELLPLVKENMPNKLAEVAWDRVPSKFPVQYQRNAIASTLASRLVYQEGIHLVETQPVDQIAHRAFMYYREDEAIKRLTEDLQKASEGAGLDALSVEQRTKVLDIVRRGGARTSLGIF